MGFSPYARDNAIVGKAQYNPHKNKRRRLSFERRVLLLSFFVALPGVLLSEILIWLQDWSTQSKLGLSLLLIIVCWILTSVLHEHVIRPLQTLSNVIAALREEDFSFRVRGAVPDDALGELSLEVNDLTDLLADQRKQAMEATAL